MQDDALVDLEGDTYIILETLEHIEKDVDLIAKVPVGKRVILSVPNFDAIAHVRFFDTKKDVVERYKEQLTAESVKSVSVGGRSKIFLLQGTRSVDV